MRNKIALITGASRGIGKAVALNLAKQDYYVILVARSKVDLEKVKKQINKMGKLSSYYALDVSELKRIKACVADIIKKHKRIDLLFNNAGIARFGTIDIDDKDINAVININLKGAIYIAKYVANQMKRHKSGYIINLSSIVGKRALSSSGIYSASKFGLVGYSESLFKELIQYGIKVTTICPSFVATDMTKEFDFPDEEMIQTNDIVCTVNYLLSLGSNAAVKEVQIECSSRVAMQNTCFPR